MAGKIENIRSALRFPEDVVHDVLRDTIQRGMVFKDDGHALAWCIRRCKWKVKDLQKRSEYSLLEDVPEPPLTSITDQYSYCLLMECMEESEVFQDFLRGLTIREIAKSRRMSSKTVQVEKTKIRRMLCENLSP